MAPVEPEVVSGADVALEILQFIGYRSTLLKATIVSYNMQDYEFWGYGTLSHLLIRQLSLGAQVSVITTPPPGKGANAAFKEKYRLLFELEKNGVQVHVNEKVHAKAYLLLDASGPMTTIIGSPNLTGPGFGAASAPDDSLVEIAVITGDPEVFKKAETYLQSKILQHNRTESFAVWFSKNTDKVASMGAI